MKKTLVASILGLASMASVLAQGNISIDTYGTSGAALITYGAANANGTSGGPVGTGVEGFTAGLYYVVGNQVAAINASFDGSGYDVPGGTLTLATGTGSTGPIGGGLIVGTDSFTVPGSQVADYTVTVVAIAYNGLSYANSTVRGHSAAFTMTAKLLGTADSFGTTMPTFAVFNAVPVPEPSTFALAGLGLAGLLIFRRRK